MHTEMISVHWVWIVTAGIFLIGVALAFVTGDDEFFGVFAALAFVGLIVTGIIWLAGINQFNESMAMSDLQEIGITKAVFEENSITEFVGEMDGKYVECAILDTEVETKFKVLCD